jgi:hypothetical protein
LIEPGASRGTQRRTVAIVLALGATVVIAAALLFGLVIRSDGAAGRSGIDATRAAAIGLDFFAGAHSAGATVANVRVQSVALGPDEHGRQVWKVSIAGDVTEAGLSFAYVSTMELYIDPSSGEVRVFAQG